MLGHPGGEEHSRYLIELSFLPPGTYTLVLDDDSNNSYQIVKI